MGSNFTFCILTLNMSNLQQQGSAQAQTHRSSDALELVHEKSPTAARL